jgi:hypothetical protein
MSRAKIPPSELLFQSPGARRVDQSTPKHVKVTVYMPPDWVAMLDEDRARMRRAGDPVDRGRMIRAAVRTASKHGTEWTEHIQKEER